MMPDQGKKRSSKRTLLITVGCLLGGGFLYLAFRDISWTDLKTGIAQMQPFYLLPAAVLVLLCQLVRALRFRVILSPFCPLSVKCLWDLMNIWAAANMILPARLAELVRPYLLQPRGASFSSSFGAVMVERFFDLSGLLLLLAIVLWNTPELPRVYTLLGEALLAALIIGYLLVLLILARKSLVHSVVDKCLSIFPKRPAAFMAGIFERLIEGFGIMKSFSQVVVIASYSVMLWVLFSFVTYVFLLAFSVEAPFLVAVTIQVLMALGVALPSAPGFIGTFHAVGRYSLALFGVNAVVAVSFATVYHLFGLGTSLLLGMVSYATSNFRFNHAMFQSHSEPEQGMPQG